MENINAEHDDNIPTPKKKTFLDTVREIDERERKEELERAAKIARLKAEKDRAEREEYSKKLALERLELIKLKSGAITEDESEILRKEEVPEKVYTKKERFENFLYHHKFQLAVFLFIAVLSGFFIHDFASRVIPDVSVMFIASDGDFAFYTEKASEVLERYCEDFNGDGKIKVRVSYLPVVNMEDNLAAFQYNQANQVKLIAEFQSADSIIVIADEKSVFEAGINEGVLKDLRVIYPDNEDVNEFGYMLNATSFAEDIDYPELADNLFIAFREPKSGLGINETRFLENFNNALKMWDGYLGS